MRIGYARVSTEGQSLDLQVDALRAAGCETVREERGSGGGRDRPVLAELLRYLRPGDTLVVWRLDRLGRSLKDLLAMMEELEGRGVGFGSVTEGIDTTTPGGRLVFQVFGALAEFERAVLRERVAAGMKAARARGRKGGRPRKLGPEQVAVARRLRADPTLSVRDICRTLGCSPATFYRVTAERES